MIMLTLIIYNICGLWCDLSDIVFSVVTEQVKNAERVQLDQIPLPDAPSGLSSKSQCFH